MYDELDPRTFLKMVREGSVSRDVLLEMLNGAAEPAPKLDRLAIRQQTDLELAAVIITCTEDDEELGFLYGEALGDLPVN